MLSFTINMSKSKQVNLPRVTEQYKLIEKFTAIARADRLGTHLSDLQIHELENLPPQSVQYRAFTCNTNSSSQHHLLLPINNILSTVPTPQATYTLFQTSQYLQDYRQTPFPPQDQRTFTAMALSQLQFVYDSFYSWLCCQVRPPLRPNV